LKNLDIVYYEIILVFIRKPTVMADKGTNGAFEEIVIRLHCKISKTGKTFETGRTSDQ